MMPSFACSHVHRRPAACGHALVAGGCATTTVAGKLRAGAVAATAAPTIRRKVRLRRRPMVSRALLPHRTANRRAMLRRSKADSRPSMPGSRGPASPRATARCRKIKGQVWREYDIRPYTLRVTTTARPEQAIVDWILRETGYETWHSDPVGLLSANRETLRVYHTPEMQASSPTSSTASSTRQADAYAFTLRVATVGNPNWRAKALPMMTPIPVQSPGVQGWLLAKENARLLLSELSRRTDYREYNSPQQLVNNGQSIVISTMRPRQLRRKARSPRKRRGPAISPKWARSKKASRSSSARCWRSTWRRPTRS